MTLLLASRLLLCVGPLWGAGGLARAQDPGPLADAAGDVAGAASPPAPAADGPIAPPPAPSPTAWRVKAGVYLRVEPRAAAKVRGLVNRGALVMGLESVEGGDRSCKEGWLRLEGDGFVCKRWVEPAPDGGLPQPQPALVAFDHPSPDEYFDYVKTGRYDRTEINEDEALVPFVYGKAWRRWTAPTWTSQRAYERGEAPEGELESNRKFAFDQTVQTRRGEVFRRADGAVVPVDKVFLYPITRFHGRDLVESPPASGHVVGWVIAYDGLTLRAAPAEDAAPVGTLDYHSQLEVEAMPATEGGAWLRVRGDVGTGQPRYVKADDVGIFQPAPRPADLDPDALWVDIDLNEQVLALMQGDQPLFATLVSTGREDKHKGTPIGLYQSYDKAAWGDMTNRDGDEDEYHVEKVPWIVHFWPRYALHGAFWHWGMGHSASHGCVNLAPRDAAYLFARIGPTLPDGWHSVYQTDAHPGTVIRIRKGAALDVPDRRDAKVQR